MNTSHAVSECEMASAILIASYHYRSTEQPDPFIIDNLLLAADSCLARARDAINSELIKKDSIDKQ